VTAYTIEIIKKSGKKDLVTNLVTDEGENRDEMDQMPYHWEDRKVQTLS
jgi:hypothetical protein